MRKIITTLFIVFGTTSSSFGQDVNNTMLWRINNPDGGKPSYLFGTMHLAQKKFMLFTDSVYSAVAETDSFFGELEYDKLAMVFIDSSSIKFFEEKAHFLDSVTKTPGWKAMVERMNRKYGTTVNPDSLDQFMSFSSKRLSALYTDEPGVKAMDLMLSDYAKSLGKKTGGLETYILQIDMLYKIIGVRVQDSTLNFDNEVELIDNFKRYYENQRLDSIDRYLQAINPNYRGIIFTQRNKTMADSIEKQIKTAPAFFAIGCGHLPGNDGVIELLRKKGFTTTPVHSDNRISLLLLNRLKDKWQESTPPEAPKEMSVAELDTMLKRLNDMKIPGSETKVELTDIKMTQLPHAPPPPPPMLKKKKRVPSKKAIKKTS
jgi:uncharacterized protein YbaP (TraB family)